MPKAYSNSEREAIISSLKKEAMSCLIQFGIRKTTVDELVKRVNIPKGTFYLFYQSKELLLFDVIMDVHNQIQETILKEIASLSDSVTVDELTDSIFKCFMLVDTKNIIKILTDGEINVLMRKLPEDVIQSHFNKDDDSIKNLIKLLPNCGSKSADEFSSAFRAIFLTSLHKREIGEKNFEKAIYMLIKGIVYQLLS